jgi:aspartate/methionine/tyrosine aminotransferase
MVQASRRARGVVAFGYDDFPLRTGDLDLRGDNSPPLEAVSATAEHFRVTAADVAGYGPVEGLPELRQAISEIFHVPASHVVVTAGGSEALHLALTCVADPGDTILSPRPAFPGFDQLASLSGLRIEHYAVPGSIPRTTGRPDIAATIVCTPHNPTGSLTPRGTEAIGRRGWMIWDISHTSLFGADADEFRCGLTETEILVCSLSKLLRLPGARLGCLIVGSPALVTAVSAAKTHFSMSASRPAQMLAEQVLRDPVTALEMKERQEQLSRRRERLQQEIEECPGLSVVPAAGGTHLLVRATQAENAWEWLRDGGLIGLPGVVFNDGYRSVRLCTAQPEETIQDAVDRIRAL